MLPENVIVIDTRIYFIARLVGNQIANYLREFNIPHTQQEMYAVIGEVLILGCITRLLPPSLLFFCSSSLKRCKAHVDCFLT